MRGTRFTGVLTLFVHSSGSRRCAGARTRAATTATVDLPASSVARRRGFVLPDQGAAAAVARGHPGHAVQDGAHTVVLLLQHMPPGSQWPVWTLLDHHLKRRLVERSVTRTARGRVLGSVPCRAVNVTPARRTPSRPLDLSTSRPLDLSTSRPFVPSPFQSARRQGASCGAGSESATSLEKERSWGSLAVAAASARWCSLLLSLSLSLSLSSCSRSLSESSKQQSQSVGTVDPVACCTILHTSTSTSRSYARLFVRSFARSLALSYPNGEQCLQAAPEAQRGCAQPAPHSDPRR